MDETAKYENLCDDQLTELQGHLRNLDLAKLSFVQLRRLQDQLKQAHAKTDQEVSSRTAEDVSGDTVRVQSPATD